MEERKVRYDPDEPDTGMIGCCARQASRSLSDVVKSINRKGKARHGHVITSRQVRSLDGQPKKKRVRKKKGEETPPIIPVRKSVVAIKLEPEGEKGGGKETLTHKCMKKVASARLQPTKFFGNNKGHDKSDLDSVAVVDAAATHIPTVEIVSTKLAKPRIKSGHPPIRIRMLMKKNPSQVSIFTACEYFYCL